jgi:16S rRNA (cytosine967-C5)-methyltransferase
LRVERSGAFASILLEQREARIEDGRDAALLHEIVLGVLRRQRTLDHVLCQVASRPAGEMDSEVRTALRIGAYSLLFLDRVPDFAAVDSAVALLGSRGHAGFVNGVLRSVARRGSDLLPPEPSEGDVEALALFHSYPGWWVARVVKRIGWQAAAQLLAAGNRPARTVFRPNLARTSPSELAQRLEQDGVQTEPGRFVPEAIRVASGRPAQTVAIREALAWVQDEAAQLVPRIFGPTVGPLVADLCAAPGGKTMQLTEQLVNGGLIVAVERHSGRLRRLSANLRRHVEGKAVAVLADATESRLPLRPGFDDVLVDAPCSGTGTLRRHPEIRWRLREEDLKLLAARQRKLLESAASLLAPGASVVYSVCSLEPEEGEDVVKGFLAAHPEFRPVDPRPQLPAAARRLVREPGFLETSPDDGELDGFFAARMVREASGR